MSHLNPKACWVGLALAAILALFASSCAPQGFSETSSSSSSAAAEPSVDPGLVSAAPAGSPGETESASGSSSVPTAQPVFADSPTPQTQPSNPPIPAVSSPAPAAGNVAAPPCLDDLCTVSGVLFLQRPIDPSNNDSVETTYRFGSTQSGMRDPHHGVEFLNGFGTPVLAAADGKVVVAGSDLDPISPHGAWPILFYGPYSNFYGSLVVIEHTLPKAVQASYPDLQGPLYTLYGHLSEISVTTGAQVKAGQQIGRVGMAGIATGSHLHFEVRLGENTYAASRNPELWLQPHASGSGDLNGAIAGHFLDSFGGSAEKDSIILQHLPNGPDGKSDFEVTTLTYEEKGLRDQPPYLESFGLGDLPAGLYRISFPMDGLRQELVEVLPGQLTVAVFRPQP